MTGRIGLEIDAYGTQARVEALADWLEIAAICKRRVISSQLEDMISDNGWTTRSPRQIKVGEDQDEQTPEDWVEAVYKTILQRQEALGDDWPYEIRGNWRVAAVDARRYVPYNALLALTVAHGWRIQTPISPEVLLETTVLRALRHHGLAAAAMGTGAGAGGFEARGRAVAAELGLTFIPEAVSRRVHAQDEGVDTVAMVGWPLDSRPAGQWIFLGQVTVASSNEWVRKLEEPRTDFWASRFGQPLHAMRFLAVPHHVASDYLTYLVSPGTGLVIDRLRMAMSLKDVSESEREVLDAVIEAGVTDGRAAA